MSISRMLGKIGKLQVCHKECYNDNPHTKASNQKSKKSVRQKERQELRQGKC